MPLLGRPGCSPRPTRRKPPGGRERSAQWERGRAGPRLGAPWHHVAEGRDRTSPSPAQHLWGGAAPHPRPRDCVPLTPSRTAGRARLCHSPRRLPPPAAPRIRAAENPHTLHARPPHGPHTPVLPAQAPGVLPATAARPGPPLGPEEARRSLPYHLPPSRPSGAGEPVASRRPGQALPKAPGGPASGLLHTGLGPSGGWPCTFA